MQRKSLEPISWVIKSLVVQICGATGTFRASDRWRSRFVAMNILQCSNKLRSTSRGWIIGHITTTGSHFFLCLHACFLCHLQVHVEMHSLVPVPSEKSLAEETHTELFSMGRPKEVASDDEVLDVSAFSAQRWPKFYLLRTIEKHAAKLKRKNTDIVPPKEEEPDEDVKQKSTETWLKTNSPIVHISHDRNNLWSKSRNAVPREHVPLWPGFKCSKQPSSSHTATHMHLSAAMKDLILVLVTWSCLFCTGDRHVRNGFSLPNASLWTMILTSGSFPRSGGWLHRCADETCCEFGQYNVGEGHNWCWKIWKRHVTWAHVWCLPVPLWKSARFSARTFPMKPPSWT